MNTFKYNRNCPPLYFGSEDIDDTWVLFAKKQFGIETRLNTVTHRHVMSCGATFGEFAMFLTVVQHMNRVRKESSN